MTETELVEEIIKLAQKHGALFHHCPDSRRCEGSNGFPDLVIAGPGGVIIAEVKSKTGETSVEQDNWAYTLTTTVYYLWRPENFESGEIEMLIRMITLN